MICRPSQTKLMVKSSGHYIMKISPDLWKLIHKIISLPINGEIWSQTLNSNIENVSSAFSAKKFSPCKDKLMLNNCFTSVSKIIECHMLNVVHKLNLAKFGPIWAILCTAYTNCQLFVLHCALYTIPGASLASVEVSLTINKSMSNWSASRSVAGPASQSIPSHRGGLRHLKIRTSLCCTPIVLVKRTKMQNVFLWEDNINKYSWF